MMESASAWQLREAAVGASCFVKQIVVAPELKGRKPIFYQVIRPFPRMLRKCIELDGVRSGSGVVPVAS